MKTEDTERLLNEACEIITTFEDNTTFDVDTQQRIDSLFYELKYADEINDELALTISERENKIIDNGKGLRILAIEYFEKELSGEPLHQDIVIEAMINFTNRYSK